MATRKRLSEHFIVEEFDSRDGAKVHPRHYRALEVLCEYWLEPMREEFGPVHVLSGYRSMVHNRVVGGASRSVHLLTTPLPGRPVRSKTMAAAADVTARGASTMQVARWAFDHRRVMPGLEAHQRGGIGVYMRSGFVHVDTGPHRDWNG